MLDIIEYPSVILSSPCELVSTFDGSIKELVEQMAIRMYESDGVGLAAPQVGVSRRIVLIDQSAGNEANSMRALVNPRVTWQSSDCTLAEEGCLSLPGVTLSVPRSLAVQVDYDDVDGKHHRVLFNKFQARIVQHEIDHLDGIMMLDRVGHLTRKLAMRGLGKNR